MYVRFVIGLKDDESHQLLGVFQAAYDLRDSGDLAEYERAWLDEALDWLNMHLKTPACLAEAGNHRAICWFHPRAKKPITYVRSIAALLNEHGHHVRMLKTDKPGQVIYEDGWQVVAKPWRR